MNQSHWAAVLLAVVAASGLAQTNTSTLDGSVTDPQGASVPRAQVTAVNTLTGQTFHTTSDEKGHWAVPSLPTASYSVSVAAPGFKKATASDVKMDAGVPATVNLVLEVGAVSETVEVTGAATVVESTSATVSSNLTGRQVSDLPIPSRNATDLIVTMPGTQTPAGPRNTTFFGLPQTTVNMTLDGVNIQDNLLKAGSGGAFYPVVYPRTDAIEEVSVTSAASGAESLGEGAIQVKFVTKSGTNTWHGGAFLQERNTSLNANTYFNNINGLPRDEIVLHQFGGHIGGPIKKNKLFIFFNYEVFRFPQTWNSGQLVVLAPSAQNGVFQYADSKGVLQQVNLLQLAAANKFPSTPDPTIAHTLSQIASATSSGGVLASRIATNNDYNRNNFTWLPPGEHKIDFPQGKLDWNITEKHHFEATGTANPYRLFPDGINGIIPIFPGSGTVLGSSTNAGQREAFWSGSTAIRSAWSAHWTSEIRFGMSSGNVLFSDGITDALFQAWNGYAPALGFVTNPYTTNNFSRRNDPVKQLNGSVSWTHGSHLANFGGSFSQINEWLASVSTQQIPRIAFGVTSNDPILSIFNTTNFPNSQPTDLTNAESLYAMLTGRVSSITRSVVLSDQTHTYGANPAVDRLRQREFGLFAQDSWKILPRLTLNYGLRFENQNPFQSLSGTYTRPGYAGLYGVSGVGNLFQPGAGSGTVPVLTQVGSDSVTGYPPTRFLSPTVGVAWVLPRASGALGSLLGSGGQSVLRAGFAVATAREQLTNIQGVWGGNQGRTITTTVDPLSNAPDVFGPAGSVLFSNPNLPLRTVATTPTYPIAVATGTSLNDFDPKIRARYVESWNLGFQRPLSKDTVVEVRYVGNRSARAWAALNLNEVNIVENHFLDQFKIAQNNLSIARAANPSSNNFYNAGLAGQQDIPIISTALGGSSNTNSTLATQVLQGQAGALASGIATTVSQMNNLRAAGYPANLFQVNPATGGSGANLTTNQGGSTYNGLQIEVRRRLAAGFQLGASYTWSHSLSTGNVISLRNLTGYNVASSFDERHAVKLNWVYELPFGPGRHFLSGASNPLIRKAIQGWQVSGISRIQSGTPSQFTSGRSTFNANGAGVVLHNLTTSQLQSMMSIRKITPASGAGQVYFLPQSLIDNSLAAFSLKGTLDPTQPYIGPPTTAGQYGNQVLLYGPWLQLWDVSVSKRTKIRERHEIEFKATALNIFNHPNFFLGSPAVNSTSFGQTTSAYNDINSTNNPGSRVIEFQLRYSF